VTEIRRRSDGPHGIGVEDIHIQAEKYTRDSFSIFDGVRRPSINLFDFIYSDDNESLSDDIYALDESELRDNSSSSNNTP